MMRALSRFAMCSLLLAEGCTTAQQNPRYPSLRPRPIEKRGTAEPVFTAPVAAPDPVTDGRIAELRKALNANESAFDSAAADAERKAIASKGDPVGGERWITAQTALAGLDILHQTTASIAADIDDAALTRASEGAPPYPALEALHDAAQAMGAAQGKRITEIQARLPAA